MKPWMDVVTPFGFREKMAAAYGVRLVASLLLLLAAASKWYQYSTGPVSDTSLLAQRWFVVGLVLAELLLALVLLANIFPRQAWAVTLACFSTFALVSFAKGLLGEASCGCFGRWEINPFLTGTFDLLVVVALWHWQPAAAMSFRFRDHAVWGGVVFLLWVALGVPATYAMAVYQLTVLAATGEFSGQGQVVILEPESWIGWPFPLLQYVDIGSTLQQGEWLVLLYHHDCPKCQEMMAKLIKSNTPSLVCVAVPPYGPTPPAGCLHGKLLAVRAWFVATPVLLRLVEGQVVSVTTDY